MRIYSKEITLMPDEAAELFTTFVAHDEQRVLADQILSARVDAVIECGEGGGMETVWQAPIDDWHYVGLARQLAYCAQLAMLEPLERQVLKNRGVTGLYEGDELHVDHLPHTVSLPNEPFIYKSILHAAKGFAEDADEIERTIRMQQEPNDLPTGVTWIFEKRDRAEQVDQTQDAAMPARATRLRLLSRTILGAYTDDLDATVSSTPE